MDFLMDIGEMEVNRVVVEEEMEASDSEEGEIGSEEEDGETRLKIDSDRKVKEVSSPRVGREDFTSAGTVGGMSGGGSVMLVGDMEKEELRRYAVRIMELEVELENKDERIRGLELDLKQSEMREKEEVESLVGTYVGFLGDLEKAKEEIVRLKALLEMFANQHNQQLRKMKERTFSPEMGQFPQELSIASEPASTPTADGEHVEVEEMEVPTTGIPVSSKKKRVSFSDSRSDAGAGCGKENAATSSRLNVSEEHDNNISSRQRHGTKTDLSNRVTLMNLKEDFGNLDICSDDNDEVDATGMENCIRKPEQIAAMALLNLKKGSSPQDNQHSGVDAEEGVHAHSSQFSGNIPPPEHGEMGTSGDTWSRKWWCLCLQGFTLERSLKDHVALKMKLNMSPCPHCSKGFPRPDYLKCHILREHNYVEPGSGKSKRSVKRKR